MANTADVNLMVLGEGSDKFLSELLERYHPDDPDAYDICFQYPGKSFAYIYSYKYWYLSEILVDLTKKYKDITATLDYDEFAGGQGNIIQFSNGFSLGMEKLQINRDKDSRVEFESEDKYNKYMEESQRQRLKVDGKMMSWRED